MNKLRNLVLIIVLVGINVSSSCKKVNDADDVFYLQASEIEGNNLRLDGYFYRINNYNEPPSWCVYFFYRNGVLLNENCWNSEEIEHAEEIFSNQSINNPTSKQRWGVINISSTIIKFESYVPSSGGANGLNSSIYEGIIITDTTFQITQNYRMIDGIKTDWFATNEIYHFKEFSPKPDSLNSFVP